MRVCGVCVSHAWQVEEDDSAALLLQNVLNKHTDNGNLDDSSAAVQRASALLARLRAAAAAVEAIAQRLVTATSAARKSRDVEFLRAAIKSALSNGLPEKHQAVVAAKELVHELEAEARAKESEEKVRGCWRWCFGCCVLVFKHSFFFTAG